MNLLDEQRLRPEIAQSWRRSEASGLSPASPTDRLEVRDIDRRSRLLRAAAPVLDEMALHLDGTGLCLILADRDSRIVSRRFGRHSVERVLDDISAVPGCQFTEETSGTNSIATPFEVRRGVAVHGDEHYLEAFKRFTCYGHPIVHPATRRLEGVLDITGLVADTNPLLAPFLVRAVTDIEQRLLDGSKLAEQRLLAAFQSVQHRASAVLALGEDVVLANSAAVDLVDPADHALLREVGRTRRGVRRLRLTSGTDVEVRVEAVSVNAGTLFELAPVRPAYRAAGRRGHAGGVLPADAVERLRHAARTRRRVLITGEPGTGRSSAAALLAGRDPVARIDAADVPALGERAWTVRLEQLVAGHRGLVVVEGVHLLPPVLAARLSHLLDESRSWLALTAEPLADLRGEHAALAARTHRRVELPALRERRADIPALARTMLGGLAPGSSLRLTAGALELLAAQPWPGNLRELESVLAEAVERRSAGDITARDLAPSCQVGAASHTLTGWEQAEHDAITKALAAEGGNKVHAARRLGISRSTLYNRMRALRITS
ncbi:transcriptional regulator of acetoin/glycerol metabolism [Prauserella shujinwangii]|uniref:Transcriptional regulator of acetoin/glycerol metabolism n=1 Tax=Prauserella shujinwangii TaxID=1453103 RepID=A0A2T0LUK4_9PSEU|nr:helix-turn-helix domain-containing protein [Prauserella shujinwangii]PRX47498.1 transcriptional regulator of acetoin/glycerol metabolism [Prauserella shujinwangii]